jgi:hypothetical protein
VIARPAAFAVCWTRPEFVAASGIFTTVPESLGHRRSPAAGSVSSLTATAKTGTGPATSLARVAGAWPTVVAASFAPIVFVARVVCSDLAPSVWLRGELGDDLIVAGDG